MATGGAPPPVSGRSLLSPMSPTSGLVAPPEAMPTSPRGGAEAGVVRCNGRRIRGKCKWFDVAKGFGFITPITIPTTGTVAASTTTPQTGRSGMLTASLLGNYSFGKAVSVCARLEAKI